MTLEASLFAYDVPFTGDAAVWADRHHAGRPQPVALAPLGDGRFDGSFLAGRPGVYPCRVRAEGYFRSKDKFTREKSLTAAIFNGDPGGQGGPNGNDPLCTLLHCLTDEGVLSPDLFKRLRELGFDGEAFLKCLETHCPDLGEHKPLRTPGRVHRPPADLARALQAEPETRAAPRPVVRDMPREMPPPQPPRIIRMFSRDAADDDMAGAARAARANPAAWPEWARQRSRRPASRGPPGRCRAESAASASRKRAGPTRDTRSSPVMACPRGATRAHAGRAHVARA